MCKQKAKQDTLQRMKTEHIHGNIHLVAGLGRRDPNRRRHMPVVDRDLLAPPCGTFSHADAVVEGHGAGLVDRSGPRA